MAATTVNRNTPEMTGDFIGLNAKAATAILAGIFLAIDGDGVAVPGTDTAGLKILGLSMRDVSADDTNRATRAKRGIFRFENGGTFTQENIGQTCYVVDNQTVGAIADVDHGIVAGRIVDVDASGVWVDTRMGADIRAGILTMGGGAASEAETVDGLLATDIVIAGIIDNASNDNVILLEFKPSTDTLTLLFNEDPTAGVKVAYAVIKNV